jgi:prepilin-type N-terminal cleavage/methylation domain-containing protein
MMRKGFTLLEIMVASLLLGMLVTALTMMFNQSSIAWRTGTSVVHDLNDVRWAQGAFQEIRDSALPGLKSKNDLSFRTVSLWDESGDNQLRSDRAFDSIDWSGAPSFSFQDAEKGSSVTVSSSGQNKKGKLFAVGVRSAGPDRKWDTADDITTWPEEIE